MIKWLFFKFVDAYMKFVPRYSDYTITKKYKYEDGMSQIWYTLNDKKYVYIGDETNFPPKFTPTFTIPIKSAYSDGGDVTPWVKMCAGPKNIIPDPKYIFYTVRWRFIVDIEDWIKFNFERILVPDKNATLEVEDILNQKRSLGRKLCHQD